MRKREELADPNSCLNRAAEEEMLFVLLGRDEAAADTVREWCALRVKIGKNKWTDPQIQNALACADAMSVRSKNLHRAASALLTKLDAVEKATSAAFVIAAIHGIPYSGPNWSEEYQAVLTALGEL